MVDMGEPLVSVLMPVYNMRQYLRRSLQSILDQTYSHLEIIVVDDGSTDGSIDSISDIRDSRLRIVSQPNGGRAMAMNTGLAQVTGDFYVAQDADDISHPDRVERQVRYMMDHPDVAAVFSGHELIVGDRRIAPRFATKSAAQCRRDIDRFIMPAHGPTPMYRMAMVSDIRFEPRLRVAEDLDYVLQVGERYPVLVMGECLYSYRISIDSSSRVDPSRNRVMEQRAVERACRRRGLDPARYVLRQERSSPRFAHRHREAVVPHFMESVLDLRRAGRAAEAMRTAMFCLRLHPLDPYYYKPLAYLVAPFGIIERYRHRRARDL